MLTVWIGPLIGSYVLFNQLKDAYGNYDLNFFINEENVDALELLPYTLFPGYNWLIFVTMSYDYVIKIKNNLQTKKQNKIIRKTPHLRTKRAIKEFIKLYKEVLIKTGKIKSILEKG